MKLKVFIASEWLTLLCSAILGLLALLVSATIWGISEQAYAEIFPEFRQAMRLLFRDTAATASFIAPYCAIQIYRYTVKAISIIDANQETSDTKASS